MNGGDRRAPSGQWRNDEKFILCTSYPWTPLFPVWSSWFPTPASASLCPRVLSRMTCDRPGVLRNEHFLEQSSTHDRQELRFLASLWDGSSVRPVCAPLPRMSMWYFQFPMGVTSSLMQPLLTAFPFLPCVSTLSVSCTSQRKSLHSNSHLRVSFWKKSISEYFYLLHLIWPIQQFWEVESYINQELWRSVGPIFCFLFFFFFFTVSQE